jgi:HEAT repeat protein
MNEELTLAIDELRQRPSNRSWFLPVLLSDSTAIPDRSIGGGETLASIQYVSLQDDWDEGIRKLLEVIQPNAAPLHAALTDLSNASKRKKIAAAGVLGCMEGSAIVAVPQLLDLLEDENDTVVASAAEALGKICGGSAARKSPEVKKVVSKLLETMRTAEVYYSSRHAARALYSLGTEGMRALLEAQAFKGYAVARDARQLIVHDGDGSTPALAELAATDPEFSPLARQLLSEINDWKEHLRRFEKQ